MQSMSQHNILLTSTSDNSLQV